MYGNMFICTYTHMYTCEIQQYDNLNQNLYILASCVIRQVSSNKNTSGS